MTIAIATVADSISKLSVSGVTIKDLDELPDEVKGRDCPILIPAPDFIPLDSIERQSTGTGTGKYMDYRYTLKWRYLHRPVGTERNLGVVYPAIIAKVMLIVDEIVENDDLSGAVDANYGGITALGVVTDPSENQFWGADFQIEILEFIG